MNAAAPEEGSRVFGLLRRLRAHVRVLWPDGPLRALLPLVSWPAIRLATGARRWELGALLVAAPLLAYTSERTKRFYVSLLPLGLVGVGYDVLGVFRNGSPSPPRALSGSLETLDAVLFGPRHAGRLVSWPTWFRTKRAPWVLDAFTALPYAAFLASSVVYVLLLAHRDPRGSQRFGWSFFAVNIAGLTIHTVLPAAPPWYLHRHGTRILPHVHAYEGAVLERVDSAIGFPFFRSTYARSSEVFGALPSLHVAYPTLIALESFRSGSVSERRAAVGFLGWMSFSAVYLDHHWVIDVLTGITLACATHKIIASRFDRPNEWAEAFSLDAPKRRGPRSMARTAEGAGQTGLR